jgi:Ca-activated chloride channel homolog
MKNSLLVKYALLLFSFFATGSVVHAESPASKNKKGNQLFAQGKYEDAEKAYLDAVGKAPDKPEILYNLGNSLIKQKKYDQGIQTLRQAVRNGDKAIQEHSRYNEGNALFSLGKFRESADTYIQTLRLNPNDKDAKHNLELALMQLKEQETKKSESQDRNSQEASKQGKEQQKNPNIDNQKPNASPQQQGNQMPRTEGAISKEKALQMLDAVQNQEREEQRKLMEKRARQRANGKDW